MTYVPTPPPVSPVPTPSVTETVAELASTGGFDLFPVWLIGGLLVLAGFGAFVARVRRGS